MEKNKYYTPTIEELHVGFEYEAKAKDSTETSYSTFICHGHNSIFSEFNSSTIRVKYLDREDIESLGFSNYKKAVDDWYDYIPEYKVQPFNLSYRAFRLTYSRRDYRLRVIGYEFDFKSEEEILFCGTIKNKSELKRLLKQLNINDNN